MEELIDGLTPSERSLIKDIEKAIERLEDKANKEKCYILLENLVSVFRRMNIERGERELKGLREKWIKGA